MDRSQYLTFDILSDGYINWVKRASQAPTVTIEYRINNGEWVSVTNTSTTGYKFNVVTGDKVEFRGTNSRYGGNYYNTFSGSTCQYNLYGNIMSMVNATDFENLTSFSNTYVFESMFRNTNVIDASSLLLPATVLTQACYASMFDSCSNLIQAPELPATTLANNCYSSMFSNCTGLTQAPVLPATTLDANCYTGMFYNCTSLTKAPVLPATTLARECYDSMFGSCTNLNYIKCLATDISASYCTDHWVNNVASTGSFITPSTTNWSRGTAGIPVNWTRVDYYPFGPELDELEFNYTGGTQSIEFTSESPWTATTSSDWITLSQYSGETGGNITVTIVANEFGGARTGTVEFTDGENTATLTVNQETGEYVIKLSNLYLNGNKAKLIYLNGKRLYVGFSKLVFNVDTNSVFFEMTGGTKTINITANDKWTMTLPEWITASSISGSGNASVILTVNASEDTKEDEIIVSCDGKSVVIDVVQGGYQYIPLTFEIISGGTLYWKARGTYYRTIECSVNNGDLFSVTNTQGNGTKIADVNVGDVVRIYGNNQTYSNTSNGNYANCFSFSNGCLVKAYGNIMSLIDSDNYASMTSFPQGTSNNFVALFDGCSGLTDISNIVLPATTLVDTCYAGMFGSCTSITKAPELPATTLVNGCYQYMFYGCTNLNYIKCLATNFNASNCTAVWTTNVASTGTFVTPSTTNWSTGYNGIPSNWTRVNA